MSIKEKFFLYIKDVIDQKRKNFVLSKILSFLAIFFRFGAYFRNYFYDLKILKSKKVKSKVISIGNIVVGGSGKTPFTIFLAKKLNLTHKLAIISRGYKSKAENKSIIVNKDNILLANDVGDEVIVLKNHIKNASFFVGKNKLKSAKKASKLNFDIIFIDDGFQYRKLKKDLEIVVINALDPFGKNNFLPKGYLRENPKNLKRADFVIVNNANGKIDDLENKIKKFTKSPIIYSMLKVNKFLDISKNLVKIKKMEKIAIFCAIANPDNFFKILKDLGFEIVNFLYLLDHEKISQKKLDEFIKKSINKGAKFIITTEKDIVKLDSNINAALPIIYLEIGLKITHNSHYLSTLVEKICLNSL